MILVAQAYPWWVVAVVYLGQVTLLGTRICRRPGLTLMARICRALVEQRCLVWPAICLAQSGIRVLAIKICQHAMGARSSVCPPSMIWALVILSRRGLGKIASLISLRFLVGRVHRVAQ